MPQNCSPSELKKSKASISYINEDPMFSMIQLSPGGIHGENAPYFKMCFKDGSNPTIKLVPSELQDQYDIRNEQNITISFV